MAYITMQDFFGSGRAAPNELIVAHIQTYLIKCEMTCVLFINCVINKNSTLKLYYVLE